jgi:hypothetical protein
LREEVHRPQRNWGARILECQYKGMRVAFLENELLRVGVLADKGTDIFEFNYKPRDMDFVWLSAGGVMHPTSYLSTSPDLLATFMDYYPGGWQEIFPNGGAPSSYLGAQFGQHGEVSNWGHHLAYGRPFLEEGCRIRVPEGAAVIPHGEPIHPEGRRVKGGKSHYNIGLEPFSSFPTNGLQEAVDNGSALSIGAGEERRFSLWVEAFESSPAAQGEDDHD